jgi:hypothetical protein
MNESQTDSIKRPSSVFWAGILFWFLSLGIFAMHIYFASIGTVVVSAFVTAPLLLVAAFLWLIRPRWRVTFYIGAVSLIALVVWGAITARTQYLLRAQFPQVLPQVVGSALFTVAIAWLAYRYLFGLPSRSYFQLQ